MLLATTTFTKALVPPLATGAAVTLKAAFSSTAAVPFGAFVLLEAVGGLGSGAASLVALLAVMALVAPPENSTTTDHRSRPQLTLLSPPKSKVAVPSVVSWSPLSPIRGGYWGWGI